MNKNDFEDKWEDDNIDDVARQFIEEHPATIREFIINERPPKFQEYLELKTQQAYDAETVECVDRYHGSIEGLLTEGS